MVSAAARGDETAKAALTQAMISGDETAKAALTQAMIINSAFGHWSIFGCQCNPSCPEATVTQLDALNDYILAAIDAHRKERAEQTPQNTPKDQ